MNCVRESILSRDEEKRQEKEASVCTKRGRCGREWGDGGATTKRQDIVSIGCANGKTVYEEEEGGNRGPGAKVERKQVDNDKFQSNQHNQQNIPRIPQPFYHPHIP